MCELICKVDEVLQNIYKKINTDTNTHIVFKNIKHELIDYCRKNNITKKKKCKKRKIITNESSNSLIDVLKVNQIIEENKHKTQNDKDILIICYLMKKIISKNMLFNEKNN